MKAGKLIYNGIFPQNPIFRMMLSMCPTLAVTTTAMNGIAMGLAVMAVMMVSNTIISLLRVFIPEKARIPCYILIIASIATIMEQMMAAFFPALHASLGLFLSLVVVNCILFARAEAFAAKNSVWRTLLDSIGMGLGFTLALTLLASVREIIGNGTFFGLTVFGAGYDPVSLALLPPGGFIALGLLMMAIRAIGQKKQKAGERA